MRECCEGAVLRWMAQILYYWRSVSHVVYAEHSRIRRSSMLRGLILWLLGVPLVVIVLLYLFHVI